MLQQNTFATFVTSLEQVHNDVHVGVGGSMALVPTSAYDPIFWSHHAMIDRIWYLRQISDLCTDPPPDIDEHRAGAISMTVARPRYRAAAVELIHEGRAMAQSMKPRASRSDRRDAAILRRDLAFDPGPTQETASGRRGRH